MIAALEAEFRKLLTVRSTYFLTLFVWLVLAGLAIYAGYSQHAATLHDPMYLQRFIFGSLQLVGLIAAIVSVLLIAHEYRYNTIYYSFTLGNSRSKVLFGKFVVVTGYAIVLCLSAVAIGVSCLYLGAAWHGHSIGSQDFEGAQLVGQALFYAWGYATVGLIATVLLRNLVASIAFLFVFPTLEQLSSLFLKDNANYLPLTALSNVTPIVPSQHVFSVSKSIFVVVVYLVILGVIAWVAFSKRDAN